MKSLLRDCRLVILALVVCMISLGFYFEEPAGASNADVPGNLLSYKDSLLSRRSQLLANKSEHMRCWSEDENSLKQITTFQLQARTATDNKALADARAARNSCLGNHRQAIASIDKALIDCDKDLAYVESQITRYACLR